MALKRAVWSRVNNLLGGSVFGDGLGSLGDGVFGEFSGEEEAHGGLDLSGGDGGALVVLGQTGGLVGDALKNVRHERVHDRHGLGRDTGIGVDLLQDLVDVDGVRFLSLLLLFLVASGTGGLGLAGLLGSFA